MMSEGMVDIAGTKWPTVVVDGIERPLIDYQKLIGGGYNEFWHTKKFFCVCRGSKGSKKSKTAAMKMVYLIMNYPLANGACLRRVKDTLLDSVYADIGWAIEHMGVSHLWTKLGNPMRYIYQPTKQVIMFKGMDKADKLASLSVTHGYLTFLWIEEAFELTNDEEFEKLQMSIRGLLPPGYFAQIMITFNPWSDRSWLKSRFYDRKSDDVFADVTTFRDNEFLSETDIKRYLDLYERNPSRARVVCDGDWGVSEGLIFEDWEEDEFDIGELRSNTKLKFVYGMDFGFSDDPTAFIAAAVDIPNRKLYIFDEMYEYHIEPIDIARKLRMMGYDHEKIIADNQASMTIYELKHGNGLCEIVNGKEIRYSLPNIDGSIKGKGSIENGILRLQSFHMIVHPRCSNIIKEFTQYRYDENKDGVTMRKPIDDFNHACDALRYATESIVVGGTGYVAEARGSDETVAEPVGPARRCYSASDLCNMEEEKEEDVWNGGACRVYSTYE